MVELHKGLQTAYDQLIAAQTEEQQLSAVLVALKARQSEEQPAIPSSGSGTATNIQSILTAIQQMASRPGGATQAELQALTAPAARTPAQAPPAMGGIGAATAPTNPALAGDPQQSAASGQSIFTQMHAQAMQQQQQ